MKFVAIHNCPVESEIPQWVYNSPFCKNIIETFGKDVAVPVPFCKRDMRMFLECINTENPWLIAKQYKIYTFFGLDIDDYTIRKHFNSFDRWITYIRAINNTKRHEKEICSLFDNVCRDFELYCTGTEFPTPDESRITDIYIETPYMTRILDMMKFKSDQERGQYVQLFSRLAFGNDNNQTCDIQQVFGSVSTNQLKKEAKLARRQRHKR